MYYMSNALTNELPKHPIIGLLYAKPKEKYVVSNACVFINLRKLWCFIHRLNQFTFLPGFFSFICPENDYVDKTKIFS